MHEKYLRSELIDDIAVANAPACNLYYSIIYDTEINKTHQPGSYGIGI